MELLAGAVLLGLIPAFIAKRKRRNAFLWWIYGSLLFLIALPHALLLRPKSNLIRHSPPAKPSRISPSSTSRKLSPDLEAVMQAQEEDETFSNDRGKSVESRLVNIWLSVALGIAMALVGLIYIYIPTQKEHKEQPLEPTIQGPSVFATSDLNIRSGPSTSSRVVRRAVEGEQLFYDDKKGGWYHLRSNQDQQEWVHQSVISLSSYQIDIPELLGPNAYQVQQIMEAAHGKPHIFKKPVTNNKEEVVGTMFWKIGDFRFGFDFFQNGDIGTKRDGKLVFVGYKEKGHSIERVLRAGSLREGSPGYVLKVTTLGDMIEVLIMPPH